MPCRNPAGTWDVSVSPDGNLLRILTPWGEERVECERRAVTVEIGGDGGGVRLIARHFPPGWAMQLEPLGDGVPLWPLTMSTGTAVRCMVSCPLDPTVRYRVAESTGDATL